MEVQTKRVYEAPAAADGTRILIDRLWPRGISREEARIDGWERELAPSRELRIWFSHQPERFAQFRLSYIEELRRQRPRLSALRARARAGALTLLYGARDRDRNNAVVLAEVLRRGLPRGSAGSAWAEAPR
ncbi:MAG: DUF488 family protein [Actinobacteria bacterium]|nr:DUF488 family protein [Actinomycetota bacterium]